MPWGLTVPTIGGRGIGPGTLLTLDGTLPDISTEPGRATSPSLPPNGPGAVPTGATELLNPLETTPAYLSLGPAKENSTNGRTGPWSCCAGTGGLGNGGSGGGANLSGVGSGGGPTGTKPAPKEEVRKSTSLGAALRMGLAAPGTLGIPGGMLPGCGNDTRLLTAVAPLEKDTPASESGSRFTFTRSNDIDITAKLLPVTGIWFAFGCPEPAGKKSLYWTGFPCKEPGSAERMLPPEAGD